VGADRCGTDWLGHLYLLAVLGPTWKGGLAELKFRGDLSPPSAASTGHGTIATMAESIFCLEIHANFIFL